jgi:hypothetical protein
METGYGMTAIGALLAIFKCDRRLGGIPLCWVFPLFSFPHYYNKIIDKNVEGTAATVEKAAKESPWLDQQKNQSKRKKGTTNEIPERYQSEAMKWHVLAKICRRKSQLFPGGTPATSHSQPRRPDYNPFRKLQGIENPAIFV